MNFLSAIKKYVKKKKKSRCCNFTPSCNHSFLARQLYNQHLRNVHRLNITQRRRPKSDPSIKPDLNDPNFYCKPCKTSYLNNGEFRKHLRRAHQFDLPSLKPEKNPNTQPDPDDPNFDCKSCNSKYLDRVNFYVHLRNTHKMSLGPLRSKKRNLDIEPDPNDPKLLL